MPTIGDLQQLQALPLEAKIRKSEERIREWVENMHLYVIVNRRTKKTRQFSYFKEPTEDGLFEERVTKKNGKEVVKLVKVPHSKLGKYEYVSEVYDNWVYVSNSGGKDSAVLRDLVKKVYGEAIPNVFVNTGVEFPGNVKFIKGLGDVEIIHPDKHFYQIVKEYGYPIVSKEVCECVQGARKYVASLIESSRISQRREEKRREEKSKITHTSTRNSEVLESIRKLESIPSVIGGGADSISLSGINSLSKEDILREIDRIAVNIPSEALDSESDVNTIPTNERTNERTGFDIADKYRKTRGIGRYRKKQHQRQTQDSHGSVP